MRFSRTVKMGVVLAVALALSSCGAREGGGKGLFGKRDRDSQASETVEPPRVRASAEEEEEETIWDLFETRNDPNTTIRVNKYIWVASLDVLNFLPVEAIDPFSGLIVTGYGTPPGGTRAYRATIHVRDPALDARSLTVSLHTRDNRPVARETTVAIEDAILTHARILRRQDERL